MISTQNEIRPFIKEIMLTLLLIAGKMNWNFHSGMVQEKRHSVKVIYSSFDETNALLLLLLSFLFNIWNSSKTISHTKMDYLNLEKKINRWKLINVSKINFIYILNIRIKVDIDYKDNA